MSAPGPQFYQRYQGYRHWVEAGGWVLVTIFNAMANTITVRLDIQRTHLGFALWEPQVWEWSSGLMWLLLIAFMAQFTRRFPLRWGQWRQQLALHLTASVVVSLGHVLGMVGMRELAYRLHGADYHFGDWASGLYYEYLKDVRSYLHILIVMEAYRLLLRRLQGEVRVLDPPEDAPPEEPVDRPRRFLVRKLNREFLVATEDIEWLEAEGNYVRLRVHQHDYLLRSTLAGIEQRLDPERFQRVHRSYIVNLDRVRSIEPLDNGDARVHLHDGACLPCSRRYRSTLRMRSGAEAAVR
jgi:hypothetical protein